MNINRIRVISFLSSGMLIIFLFIYIAFAWFVTSKEANVSGINTSVKSEGLLITEVNYYKVNSTDTESGITFSVLDKYSSGNVNMPSYDELNKNSNQVLMEIVLDKSSTVNNLKVVSEATSYTTELKATNNSLSGIIEFYYVEGVNISDGSSTYTVSDNKSFVNLSDGVFNFNNRVDLFSEEKVLSKVYVLIGYNEESIENIYSNNLGNDILNSDVDISYKCDFSLFIQGGVSE